MNEIEALDYTIDRMRGTRHQYEENLYGHRYKDLTKHPNHEAYKEILDECDDAINVLVAMRERLAGVGQPEA